LLGSGSNPKCCSKKNGEADLWLASHLGHSTGQVRAAG
jgi:hypothetical protein